MAFIRKIKRGNYTYLQEVKNVWDNGRVKQKHIRYIGKEVDGKQMLSGSIENAKIDKVSVHGPLLIVDAVAKQINLSKLLGEYGEYLLSLAYAHCVSPNSVRKITKWFERTDIHSLLNIPDVTYEKLLDALDSVNEGNGDLIQNKIFRSVKEQLKLKPDGYFYDVTSAYFYGVKCPIAKKKKKPKSKNQPQIQIGLAVTKNEGIPIFHKVFEGNIFDGKTLPDILVSLRDQGIKDAFLIWDRGVSSEFNISEAMGSGFKVLCGLALKGDVKETARNIVAENILATIEHRVRLKSSTFYAKKFRYRYQGIPGYLVVCLNEKKKQCLKEQRYDNIAQAQKLLSQKKEIKPDIKKYLRGSRPNYAAIREAETFDGVSAIFCTKNLSQDEIIHAYFEKDRIEKAFRTMKGLLEADKIRFWLTGKVKAHVFVCYLSYLLLSLIDYRLRSLRGVNAINALEVMESMYKVFITDPKTKNKFVKTVALSKEQEKILKAIDPRLLKHSVHN